MDDAAALRTQLSRQFAHWRAAVVTIDDADNFASTEAWTRVERQLGLALRQPLQATATSLRVEITGLGGVGASPVLPLEHDRLRLTGGLTRSRGAHDILAFFRVEVYADPQQATAYIVGLAYHYQL